MNGTAVIDASAALTLLLAQTGSVIVRETLAGWRRAGVTVQVPSHFWLEVPNSLRRRHGLPASIAIEAIHRLDEVGLETVDLSRPMTLLALHLAEQHGLTTYDAAYLAVAQTADGMLLSADGDLLHAAGDRAIPVAGGNHRLAERAATYEGTRATWPSYGGTSAYLARLRAEAGKSPGGGQPRR